MPAALPPNPYDDVGGASGRIATRSTPAKTQELHHPPGTPIVSGLIVSQLLTFYTTAIVYFV